MKQKGLVCQHCRCIFRRRRLMGPKRKQEGIIQCGIKTVGDRSEGNRTGGSGEGVNVDSSQEGGEVREREDRNSEEEGLVNDGGDLNNSVNSEDGGVGGAGR